MADPTPDNNVEPPFTPQDGGTLMVLRMSLPDAATRSAMLAGRMTDGLSLCCDLLETLV